MVRNGVDLGPVDVTTSARILDRGQGSPAEVLSQAILTARGKSIRPKTLGQKAYVDAIDENTITFGIGPAGTGKTYLAMAKAVQALQRKEVERIILTPPGGRGGGAARVPARHAHRQDRPVPAAALRRAQRDDGSRARAQAARGRHGRGRAARLHARPHAQQRVRRARRGAEHHARADEDVPHPPRLRHARWSSPATSPRSTCPAGASGLQLVTARARRASTTSTSRASPARTSCGTRLVGRIVDAYTKYDAEQQARAYERAPGGRARTGDAPPRLPPAGPQAADATAGDGTDEHRDQQRVGRRGRRGRAAAARDLRARPPARASGCRPRDPAGRRGRHGAAARAVDGRARPDRRAELPDGRAAPGHRRRAHARRPARRHRALPAGRGRAGGDRRPLHAWTSCCC